MEFRRRRQRRPLTWDQIPQKPRDRIFLKLADALYGLTNIRMPNM